MFHVFVVAVRASVLTDLIDELLMEEREVDSTESTSTCTQVSFIPVALRLN